MHGVVLCIGDDGHFAIEVEHGSQNCSTQLEEKSTIQTYWFESLPAVGIGSCIDIPLANSQSKLNFIQKRTDVRPFLFFTTVNIYDSNRIKSHNRANILPQNLLRVNSPLAVRNLNLLI